MLVPPASAPPRVKAVIAAANQIRSKPYIYGGGHARWWDRGYDCSGSVSFALHGGKFLESPLPSGPLESWGEEGEGRWITVYANPGHAYAVIAGSAGTPAATKAAKPGRAGTKNCATTIGFVAAASARLLSPSDLRLILRPGQRGRAHRTCPLAFA